MIEGECQASIDSKLLFRSSLSLSAFAVVLAAAMAALLLANGASAAPSPAAAPSAVVGEPGGDLGSALEYLQRLDRFYSQVARPR